MTQKSLIIPIFKDQIFIQDRRNYKKPDFGFFGGKVKNGESSDVALVREVLEELSMNIQVDDVDYLGQVFTNDDRGLMQRNIYLLSLDTQPVFEEEGKGFWMDITSAHEKLNSEGMTKTLELLKWFIRKDEEVDLYQEIKHFIATSFGANKSMAHFERAVYWIKYLSGRDNNLAYKIAAYSHDIERAFRDSSKVKSAEESSNGFLDEEMLRIHQNTGAKIIKDKLFELGAESDLINQVYKMIQKHEEGGSSDQNLMMDADSISFFENNAEHFVKKFLPKLGKEKIQDKFDWMYNRIKSNKAKRIAKPMYEEYISMIL